MTLIEMTELTVTLRKFGTATYVRERSGISFHRMLFFETSEKVATDRLLVTDEAVRVLDSRE